MWFADREIIDVGHLPPTVRMAGETLLPARERRRQIADDLYDALVSGGYSFWEHIHPIFLQRDITRHDIRELVVRGLRTTHGNYRALLRLFGISHEDYKRFHNFLMTHGCKVDYRAFRQGTPEPARVPRVLLPPLRVVEASACSKGLKSRAAASGEMPMPVSRTAKRMTTSSPLRARMVPWLSVPATAGMTAAPEGSPPRSAVSSEGSTSIVFAGSKGSSPDNSS